MKFLSLDRNGCCDSRCSRRDSCVGDVGAMSGMCLGRVQHVFMASSSCSNTFRESSGCIQSYGSETGVKRLVLRIIISEIKI